MADEGSSRPPARVDVILARDASTAVVFRRGPSRWTLVLRWDTATDSFEEGDWFRGRLYTRRCDLSPDGERLVYFAANFRVGQHQFRFGYSWTAVCAPPRLRPIGLWVKDDCWFGGGLFIDNDHLRLNERPSGGFERLGMTGVRVDFDSDAHGEDEPIYAERLDRDGWRLLQPGVIEYAGAGFRTPQPEIRRKEAPNGSALHVHRSVEGFTSIDNYSVITTNGSVIPLVDVQWADWDQRQRLVYARLGTLWSAELASGSLVERQLVDLNPHQPDE